MTSGVKYTNDVNETFATKEIQLPKVHGLTAVWYSWCFKSRQGPA